MSIVNTTFRPKTVIKDLLADLSQRGRDIIIERYGLGPDATPKTLEAIGERYGITRERVRQIENHSLDVVRSSDAYKRHVETFEELRSAVKGLGSVVSEEDLLAALAKSKSEKNHFHFLLVVGEHFEKHKEDEHFKHRWHVDPELSEKIHDSLQKLYQSLSDEELVSEPDFIKKFLEHIKDVSEEYKKEEIVRRWLSLSKKGSLQPARGVGKGTLSECAR